MDVQALFPEPSVEAFDHCIVRRLAEPAELDLHLVRVGPLIHLPTDELRSVVAVNPSRHTALVLQPLHDPHDVLSFEALTDFDLQTLARKHIDDRQCAESSTVSELVMYEIHAPHFVAPGRRSSHLAMNRRDMTPRSLSSQSQALFAVNAI